MTPKKSKLIVMDVDGTMTDGTINISANGELFKAFSVRDGQAIKHFLPREGIEPVIITGRNSNIVKIRAKELDIIHLYQNISNKVDCLTSIKEQMRLGWSDIAYIGDDVNDLEAMQLCGISGCPADAVKEVKAVCDYVCEARGGQGAVREFIEWLLEHNSHAE